MFPVAFVSSPAESHPACSPVGTEGPFPEVKRGRGVTLTTHHHLVPGSRMNRSYTPCPLHGGSGTALLSAFYANASSPRGLLANGYRACFPGMAPGVKRTANPKLVLI
jgi:hypothetical protein